MPVPLPKVALRSPFVVASLFAALSLTLLAGCGSEIPYPGEDAVALSVGPGCTLVSAQEMEHLPEKKPGFRRVAYPYVADCVPEGGATARRVRARIVFEEYSPGEMLGGGKTWSSNRELLDDPVESQARGTRTVTLTSTDCTDYVQRVVNEVLPCLREQMPELVAPLQEQVDAYWQKASFEAVTPNQAAAEIAYDVQCLHRWRQLNLQLPSGNAPGACGLKD